MKKTCAWLLALVMMLSCIPALAQDADTLTVGTTTAMTGNFLNSMFGSNTADMDVQDLLHDYALTKWSAEYGTWVFNTQVVRRMTAENVDGHRRYHMYIRSDLKYSDGSPITAWDYAFSILLSLCPQVQELGASVSTADHIWGSRAYRTGEALSLRGVRVLDNNHLIVVMGEDHTPDFYELSLLNYRPYPIEEIAPGCKVVDGEVGCKIEGGLTAETLAQTLFGAENGYVTHPKAVSGPYVLTGYDAAKSIATFEKNPYHIGNSDGETASISKITYKLVSNDEAVALLESGEIDLMNKAMRADVLDAALALVNEGKLAASSYERSGLSFISFACERPGVSSQAVRQAIAHCLNAQTVVDAYVGGYGQTVNGFYGAGQWMAKQADPAALASLPAYAFDAAKAAEILENDGWTLNAEGVREKAIDGETVTLSLKLIYPEGNAAGAYLTDTFAPQLEQAGIRLTVEAMPFAQLLQVYYRQTERDADMIYLASNFGLVYDPSGMVDPAAEAQGVDNRTGIADETLHALALEMRKTAPGDMAAYCEKWLQFQQRWMEVLPAIPVYANVYYDLYTVELTGYEPAAELTWAEAILGATLNGEK